ncbi:hypothetical protein R2103_03825 [Nitrosomonas sp. Is24]|uniref:hypothetical protein n=1 Tax=Nitrosomonas sp. Is24 TaxID=3080533 RepID=UPI00294A9A96|nr:hypothetical protein [Nitrosomonas sp. Is24]MDV6340897.1 hypothetical protein [Nitrosomonas sp. Is24]
MTVDTLKIESTRLLSLLKIVRREGALLQKTDTRLFTMELDAAWVERLENDDDLAERLDAFVSRFGRMQDTVGDKLIPALLRSMAEKTGSALDNLNRAEKLGLLPSVEHWLNARNLRNKLIHEYVSDPEEFAAALNKAHATVSLLVTVYNSINRYARSRIPAAEWPELLP